MASVARIGPWRPHQSAFVASVASVATYRSSSRFSVCDQSDQGDGSLYTTCCVEERYGNLRLAAFSNRRPLHSSARTPRRSIRSPGCEPRGRAWSRPSPTPDPPRSIHRGRDAIVASSRRRHAAVHGVELHRPLPGALQSTATPPPAWRLASDEAAPLFGSFTSLAKGGSSRRAASGCGDPVPSARTLSKNFWAGLGKCVPVSERGRFDFSVPTTSRGLIGSPRKARSHRGLNGWALATSSKWRQGVVGRVVGRARRPHHALRHLALGRLLVQCPWA